ncbi:hypothetical protein [Aquimonas sp.]|jgi:hypothetical protein|uniref:hypothetical protein n=1 Tax=Aquimonas sp. TaxID=1872588 RepID=UPI0037BEDA2E
MPIHQPLLILMLLASAPAFAWPGGEADSSKSLQSLGGCDAISAETHPIRYNVSFEGDIRPFITNQCASCHGSQGGLSLSTANARVALIGANERGTPSNGNSAILRVRPFEPLASSLFLKLNCDVPPFGGRMPLGGSASTEFQALVYDWIASGALMPDSFGGERLFIGSFEDIVRP